METLSGKIFDTIGTPHFGRLYVGDVKEFIRKLKGNFSLRGTQLGGQEKKAMVSMKTINKIIDELAGDKLT